MSSLGLVHFTFPVFKETDHGTSGKRWVGLMRLWQFRGKVFGTQLALFSTETIWGQFAGAKNSISLDSWTANRTFKTSKLKHHFEKYQNRKCINSDEHVDDDESDFADEDIVQEASLVVCKWRRALSMRRSLSRDQWWRFYNTCILLLHVGTSALWVCP